MANPTAALLKNISYSDNAERPAGPASPRKADPFTEQIMRDIKARNHAAAIAGLQKALTIRKKDCRLIRWLVVVANDADDLVLAHKYARKLVELEPQVAGSHMLLGTVLDRLSRFDEAVKAYLKADRLQPGNPKTLNALGRAYATKGDHDGAIAYYEKALEVDPGNDTALHNYAQAKKFDAEEALPFVARLEAAMQRAEGDANRARLHFAAGKVLDDARRYDDAFAHFRAANDLTRPENPRDMSVLFANTLAAFPNKAFFEARRGFGSGVDRPIFIVGMPRSGTTLTESLCAAHPLVTAGDEQTALGSLASHLGRDTEGESYQQMVGAMSGEHASAFATAYLEHCEQTVGAATPYFTDKMPHNFLNIGLVALLFPNARIVHCRRHLLDSGLSLYTKQMASLFHQQYKTDLASLGEHCRSYVELMDHWHAVLPGRIHDVFYEDLVANTEWNARAIIDFLGLEWDNRVIERSGSQRRVATASQWQVRQPVYQTSKERWRRYEEHLGALIGAIGRDKLDAYERELAALDREQPN